MKTGVRHWHGECIEIPSILGDLYAYIRPLLAMDSDVGSRHAAWMQSLERGTGSPRSGCGPFTRCR
jgi:hypothetical protein